MASRVLLSSYHRRFGRPFLIVYSQQQLQNSTASSSSSDEDEYDEKGPGESSEKQSDTETSSGSGKQSAQQPPAAAEKLPKKPETTEATDRKVPVSISTLLYGCKNSDPYSLA